MYTYMAMQKLLVMAVKEGEEGTKVRRWCGQGGQEMGWGGGGEGRRMEGRWGGEEGEEKERWGGGVGRRKGGGGGWVGEEGRVRGRRGGEG